MAVRPIYCHELEFTGCNLLDPTQPIFVIASADISTQRTEEVLRDSFPRYQAAGCKLSNI